MKNIHFLGFLLWFIASFICFKFFTMLLDRFDSGGMMFKIIVVFITALIVILGFYKILLTLFFLVNKNHKKFNLISTSFSMIGLIGFIASYMYFGFEFSLEKGEMLSQALTFTFGLFLVIILFNGFVLFPKSLSKFNN